MEFDDIDLPDAEDHQLEVIIDGVLLIEEGNTAIYLTTGFRRLLAYDSEEVTELPDEESMRDRLSDEGYVAARKSLDDLRVATRKARIERRRNADRTGSIVDPEIPNMGWRLVGRIKINSGYCWVADVSHQLPGDDIQPGRIDFDGLQAADGAALGVLVQPEIGEGEYPVYLCPSDEGTGRTVGVFIDFRPLDAHGEFAGAAYEAWT